MVRLRMDGGGLEEFFLRSVRLNTFFVVMAAFLWGLAGGIGGVLLEHGWPGLVVALYRGGIGFLFIAIWLAVRPRRSGFGNWRLWAWSVPAGLGVAGNFGFYFLSIGDGSIAIAVTLMYCAPIYVYVVSILLGWERVTAGKSGGVAFVLAGVVLLTGLLEGGVSGATPFGVLSGVLSGVSYAVFIFSFKKASCYGSPLAVLLVALGTLIVVLLGLVDRGQALSAMETMDWLLFVVLGVLGAGISFVLYIRGLRKTPAAVASMVAIVEPVTASLFGVVILGESLSLAQMAGMGLILATVRGLSILGSSEPRNS